MKDLERDGANVPKILSEEDRRHAATSEFAFNRVFAVERFPELGEELFPAPRGGGTGFKDPLAGRRCHQKAFHFGTQLRICTREERITLIVGQCDGGIEQRANRANAFR